MLNKDFMKQLLAEEKKLLELSQVRHVHVPHYDELSVKKFWPLMHADRAFMMHMPDPTPDGRLPERGFFWNVLNTLQPAYVTQLIDHANAQRMTAQEDGDGVDAIEITDEWWEKLQAKPFISCKFQCAMIPTPYRYIIVYCAENKGRTLHLLKKQSKAVPQHRKRVKRDIFASPLDFQQLHSDFAAGNGAAEEQKHERLAMQAQAQAAQVDNMRHSNLGHVPVGGGPNIIGNLEDGPVLPEPGQPSEPGTPQAQSMHHLSQGGDQIMYREI